MFVSVTPRIYIKGFQKETDLSVILDILKKAGLPFDSKKEDLGTSKRNGANDIWIYDLKRETLLLSLVPIGK